MKIAIVPDIHLNKSVYKGVKDRDDPSLPFRSADFMRAFGYIVDLCINEIHPDVFVIPGDVYDHPSPSNKVRGFFSSQLQKLTFNKIPVIILLGNHDVFMKDHALKDIKELALNNVKVIEEPAIFSFKGIKILACPYSMDVEQKKVSMKEEFTRFLKEIKNKDDGTPSLFFGHFAVHGAKMNEYVAENILTDTTTTLIPDGDKQESTQEYINRNPNDIRVEDLDDIGAEYVFLGDFHEFQVLKTKECIAMYGGSIERTDFSEVNQKKGFVLYDSDLDDEKPMGKCKFIEYPNSRPMIELNGNFETIRRQFAGCDLSKYQDAIVKIAFKGSREELVEFSSGLEAFKKELREKINPIHIASTQKVKNIVQEEAASKLEKEIMEKGHLEAQDVIDVAKELVKERVSDKTGAQKIIDLAEEIYNEVTKG